MLICVSGVARAGKNTVTDALVEQLKFPLIRGTLKMFAKEQGMEILQFEKGLKMTSEWDIKLDIWTMEQVKKELEGNGKCIVDAMLSAHLFPEAELKIWLDASAEVRAGRSVKEGDKFGADAVKYIQERDNVFRERIRKIYGFDFWDPTLYDLIINTGKEWNSKPEKIVNIVKAAIQNTNEKNPRDLIKSINKRIEEFKAKKVIKL